MTSRTRTLWVAGAAVALAIAWAPVARSAPAAKWNQERVAGYAAELAQAARELETAAAKGLLPTAPPAVAQQKARYDFLEALRLFENSAHHLAAQLKAGKGREETNPIFRRLRSLRHDVESASQRMVIPESVMGPMLKAGELLLRIGPYYAQE